MSIFEYIPVRVLAVFRQNINLENNYETFMLALQEQFNNTFIKVIRNIQDGVNKSYFIFNGTNNIQMAETSCVNNIEELKSLSYASFIAKGSHCNKYFVLTSIVRDGVRVINDTLLNWFKTLQNITITSSTEQNEDINLIVAEQIIQSKNSDNNDQSYFYILMGACTLIGTLTVGIILYKQYVIPFPRHD